MPDDPLLAELRTFVHRHELLGDGERVVVGVSGGVDSVVLLHLLREVCRPVAVHIDHGMREDSGDDAAFVSEMCGEWGVEVHIEKVEVAAGPSRQAEARRVRYLALERVALDMGIGTVAVAHQRDDVAETLLLQLARGAGPRGWSAMPVSRPIRKGSSVRLVRPLRFAERREIEAYARAQGLSWREDPSNAMLTYRRSVVRKRLFPVLEKHFGEGVIGRIAAAAELAEDYLASGAALASDDALREATVEPGALSIDALRKLDSVVRRGVILELLAREYPDVPRSAHGVVAIEALLDAQPGKRHEIGAVTVWREREVLRFTRSEQPTRFIGNLTVPGKLDTPMGTLVAEHLDEVPDHLPENSRREVVDADELGTSLTLRSWQEGDRLAPIGMEGTKKVSDLLTERRVPSSERARQLVLVANGEIVWVVGHRLAEPFRVRAKSRRAVMLEWRPG